MDFLTLMQKRYTAKYYDHEKHIPEETWKKILECVRLSPSSVNMQGWRFITLESDAQKAVMRPAIADFNIQRYDGCDKVMVLCYKDSADPAWAQKVSAQMTADGRQGKDMEQKVTGGLLGFAKAHEQTDGPDEWQCKQTYIAMGTALYAAASYGVDSTACEGFDMLKAARLLGLEGKGFKVASCILFGYRAEKDSNTLDKRPKSRLPFEDVIERRI